LPGFVILLQPWQNPPREDGRLMQFELEHNCHSPCPKESPTIQAAVAKEMMMNNKEILPRIAMINQGSFIFC